MRAEGWCAETRTAAAPLPNRLTALLIFAGVLGLLTLPLHERHVRADEKSLMIGGARSTLRCGPGGLPGPWAHLYGHRPPLSLLSCWEMEM